MRTLMLIAVLTLMVSATVARASRVDCEPARCAVQAAIAAECPCETASNHGRYVSCVAHVVRQLSADGTIPVNCRGKVTRCAARSTCGKPGFVTCQIPTSTCAIPPAAPTGTCESDPAVVCTTDLDCGARCKVKASADHCAARGGVVGAASTCCASCAP